MFDDKCSVSERKAKDVYYVEEIRGKRMQNKIPHYEVKWVDYEETTWEPASNLSHLEAVREFEASLQKKKRSQSRDKANDSRSSKEIMSGKCLHFDKNVNKRIRAQLKQLGPIPATTVSRLVSQGMRVQDILGIEKESNDVFIRYKDGSYGREPMLVLRALEGEKLNNFLAAQLWEMMD